RSVGSRTLTRCLFAGVSLNRILLHPPPPLTPEPVMIDFEAIDKKAAAPTAGNPPPNPKDAPVAQETTKAPPPKSADPAPAPEKPKPDLAEVKPPPPPPTVEKPKPEIAKPADDVIPLTTKEPEPRKGATP